MTDKTETEPSRRKATAVGVLFIIGTVAGISSALLTGPLLSGADHLAKISAHETQLVMASICVLVMACSLAMIPVVLFPVFRRVDEALALGAVLFRGALEATMYIAVAMSWFLLLVLSRASSDAVETSGVQLLGAVLQGAGEWSSHILAIVFSVGALMVYWLFYVSRLIPRWLSTWGLVGALLYLAAPMAAMFGLNELGALMVPLAVQEMVLALWLIIRGFSPAPTLSPAGQIARNGAGSPSDALKG